MADADTTDIEFAGSVAAFTGLAYVGKGHGSCGSGSQFGNKLSSGSRVIHGELRGDLLHLLSFKQIYKAKWVELTVPDKSEYALFSFRWAFSGRLVAISPFASYSPIVSGALQQRGIGCKNVSMKRRPLRNPSSSFAWMILFFLAILSNALATNERATSQLAEIPSSLQHFVDAGDTTGVVFLAAHQGKVISHAAVGYQSLEADVAMDEDSIFWAASMSKPFVAVAVMMLVEEGRLSLEDPVAKHIPEFKGMLKTVPDYGYVSREVKLVKPDRPLTVQDCLNHTHGLPATGVTEAAESIRERVIASARSTLDWEPGSKWRYGGDGLHVAAYLVEKYSGMSYAEFLKKRVFEPLGMRDTYFMLDEVPKDRLVGHYRRGSGETEWKADRFYNPVYFNPEGGLYSTAEDMFRFYQMMLNDGVYKGERLLTKHSVKQLITITCGHLEKGDHIPNCYSALGFRVVREATDPRTSGLNPGAFGHGGSGGSNVWADPTNDTIYIFMRNNWGSSQTPMIETVQKIVSEAVE